MMQQDVSSAGEYKEWKGGCLLEGDRPSPGRWSWRRRGCRRGELLHVAAHRLHAIGLNAHNSHVVLQASRASRAWGHARRRSCPRMLRAARRRQAAEERVRQPASPWCPASAQ